MGSLSMRLLLLALAMLAASAPAARAQGINLSWDECGAAGVANKGWSCDAETGTSFPIVASVVAPAGLEQVLAIECHVDVRVGAKQLPDWWRYGGGACRGSGALTVDVDFGVGPKPCSEFTTVDWTGGIAIDVPPEPNRARYRIVLNGPFEEEPVALAPGTEYYAFAMRIARAPTQSCAGCAIEACVVLNSLEFYQTPDKEHVPALVSAPVSGRSHVTWQVAKIPNCPNSTPARASTWGSLKRLYR
jgi:hypothetical protein